MKRGLLRGIVSVFVIYAAIAVLVLIGLAIA